MTDEATGGLGALGALRVLRRRAWLIVLLTLLVTGAAVAYSVTSPEQYDATAQLEAIEETATEIDTQAGVQDPERKVNNITQLLRLDPVAQAVSRRLDLGLGTSELLDKLSTDVAPNSDIVSLTIRDESPRIAAAVANAWVAEFVAFRKRQAGQRFDEAAARAQREYEGLSPEEKGSTEGRDLLGQARRLRTEASLQTGGVRPVLRAAVPSSPAAPRPKVAAVVGLGIGLVLALGAAFALELLDRRLKEEEDFEAVFGLPILASIPRPARRGADGIPSEDVGQQEGYGTLAANFRFSNLTEDLSVVMITSGGPGEGKTSVTLGLACQLTNLGQRVIAIEADLRRPSFSRYLHLPASGGLAAVLAGGAELRDELVAVDGAELRPLDGAPEGEAGLSFSVLPAGRIAPSPQRLLAGPMMAAVVARARVLADVVLVDTAPAGTVNDALTLVQQVDATIVVARQGRTTRDQARRTMRVFENLDADLLGVVLTDAPRSAAGYYGPEDYRPAPPAEVEAGRAR